MRSFLQRTCSKTRKEKARDFHKLRFLTILFAVLNHFLAEKISVRTPAWTVLEQAQNKNRLGLFFSDSISDSNFKYNKNSIYDDRRPFHTLGITIGSHRR
ncbi:hypothetical protein LSS_10673 [Leptospira santarosai serovar Shermani str. LT 821]|uniref:Uncharacterized protein n=2 Tax=Leptospira santarosai TaxID=28183 RepID=K8XZH3_9LEPT|nr:hypothetical protein LSS_10673 [Leptospira santarosai serovar Shermani str. LT 821]EMN20251.1 hypothetical protein LEP1GSC063_2509 [Leptospira santarosai serovar Arenal str. MAVJ 401]EPG83040.1 hypothetical protein LEP1GSC048_3344 [Leptospira santarosai serovar Shermani str. 1342KT]